MGRSRNDANRAEGQGGRVDDVVVNPVDPAMDEGNDSEPVVNDGTLDPVIDDGGGPDADLGGAPLFYYTMRGSRSFGFTLPEPVALSVHTKSLSDGGWRGPKGTEPCLAMLPELTGSRVLTVVSTPLATTQKDDSGAYILKGMKVSNGGVYVVTGRSGGGKSMLVRTLAYQRQQRKTAHGVFIYNVGEPRGNNRHPANASTYARILNVIARSHPGDVFVIDSLSAIAAAGGNSGTGGVSRDVLVYLELLDAAAMHRGCIVLAVINPLTKKEGAEESLVEGVKGVTSGTFELTAEVAVGGSDEKFPLGYHLLTLRASVRPIRNVVSGIMIKTPVAYLKIEGTNLPYLSAGNALPVVWEDLISGAWRNL